MNSPFVQRAQNAGFAKVLGAETSHFLLLDKDTDGTHGRRIYIDGRLAAKFNGISDTDIKFVFSKLKQLGALAGGITSLDNLNNAAEHRTIIGSVRLTYKMFQATGTANAKPGVYVTDVDLGRFGKDVPGLYKMQSNKDGWKRDKVASIRTKFAAINGYCENLLQAGGEIIPPMIKKAYSEGDEIESEGYSLFFNPPSLYSSGRLWRTPQQKRINQKVVQSQLVQVLLDGQKSPQGINWVVHSDGAKLLHQALKEIPGRDLSNHTIMFLSPTQAVSQLIPQFKSNKINLHKDVMKIQQDDWRSKSAQMFHGRRLAKELGTM